MVKIEVSASSVKDCLIAQSVGASRIELVSASYLGGLTPSLSLLDLVLEKGVTVPIMAMVRPRGAGFCYSDLEKEQMFREARDLLKHGANGIVFGFLTKEREIDWLATEKMITLCSKYGAESIFHRAFDCAKNTEYNIQKLIELGCTRILTSGLESSAIKGAKLIRFFNEKYGKDIEILAGSGINSENLRKVLEKTKVNQVHGTFKKYTKDCTTTGEKVSFSYNAENCYEEVCIEELEKVIEIAKSYIKYNN